MTLETKHQGINLTRILLGVFLALSLSLVLLGQTWAQETQSPVSVQQPVQGKRAVVRGSGAVLREQPGGAAITTLKLATAVTAVGRTADNAWLKVVLADGQEGWVQKSEVVAFGLDQLPVLDVEVFEISADEMAETPSKTTDATAAGTTESSSESSTAAGSGTTTESGEQTSLSGKIATGSRRLNVRKGPGTNFGIVSTVPSGATVNALGRNEKAGWVLIEIPGKDNQVGWVSATYVDLNGDPTDLPVSDQQSNAPVVAAASSGSSGGSSVAA